MVDKNALDEILNELGYKDYEEIVKEFQHKVYSTVYSFTQNYHDTEDLSQEIFLLIYQNLPSFKMDSKLSTWIYRIAVNRCLMYKRKTDRRNTVARFVPINEETAESIYNNTKVHEDEIYNENRTILYKALNNISKKNAAVITLKYMQDLSVKEIGQIMNLSVRTVETQLYRGRAKLKENLKLLGYNSEDNNHGL